MLAKEIKMANIKKQREFIEAQLKKVSLTNDDGDTSYPYVGHLFPEVKQYFKKEGFKIVEFNSDSITSLTKGRSIYLFTIEDEVELSDAELEEAEKCFETTNEMLTRIVKESGIENPFEAIFADALGISLPSENGEDSEHSAMLDILSVLGGNFKQENPEDIDDGYEDEEP